VPPLPLSSPPAAAACENWRIAVKEVKDELRGELNALREQATALRVEADNSVRAEREARLRDVAELRTSVGQMSALQLERMQVQMSKCRAEVTVLPRLLAEQSAVAQSRPGPQGESGVRATAAGVEALANEFESRCAVNADLHTRLANEVSDLSRRLDEHRAAIREDFVAIARQTDERSAQLSGLVERETAERCRESLELRAILDSVWQQASAAGGASRRGIGGALKYYFQFGAGGDEAEGRFKQVVGDEEDINTLYEMVREALGDTVYLKEQICEEGDHRARLQQQGDRVERQLNTMQAILRDHRVTSPKLAERSERCSGSPPKSQ